ncbi:MAG: hypothetical protein ACRC2K_02150 [Clostridium sp.]
MDYKSLIAAEIGKYIEIDKVTIEQVIKKQEDNQYGDYSFPCYEVSKISKEYPCKIAKDLSNKLNLDYFKLIKANGEYINFYLNKRRFIEDICISIINDDIKNSVVEKDKDKLYIVVEFLDIKDLGNILKVKRLIDYIKNFYGNVQGIIYIKDLDCTLDNKVKELAIDESFQIIKSVDLKMDRKELINKLELNNLIDNNVIELKKYNMAPIIFDKRDKVYLEFCIRNNGKFLFLSEQSEQYFFNREMAVYEELYKIKNKNCFFICTDYEKNERIFLEKNKLEDLEFSICKLLNKYKEIEEEFMKDKEINSIVDYINKLYCYLFIFINNSEEKNERVIISTYIIIKKILLAI